MKHLANCGHAEYLQGHCNHTGCYNAYPTTVPHARAMTGQRPEPRDDMAEAIPAPPMPSSPTGRRRSGHDTLRDLQDAGQCLRNIATFDDRTDGAAMIFPAQGDDEFIGQDDLLRWAEAIEEFVNFPRWRAHLVLAGALAVGALVGAVAVMVAS